MSEIADIGTFIAGIERELDEPFAVGMHPETVFRKAPEWDSLHSLIVVASLQENYGVTVTDEEFAATRTLEELYSLTVRKKEQG